jgi:hypothetical protein
MTALSDHFTLGELIFSQKALRLGIDNTPAPDKVANLTRLATAILEPARVILGVPLHVDSGYRCSVLNADVGGAIHSAHMDGRAADIVPVGLSLVAAFAMLKRSAIPFDQLIIECGAWLHMSVAADGAVPRGEFLSATGSPGDWHYLNA